LGEVGVLLAEGVEAPLEGGHARLEAGGVEVAGFEGGVVARDCAFGAAGLFGELATLFLERWLRSLRLRGCRIECFADEGAVAVEGGELVDDGGFEFVARDAFAVAGFATEFLSAPARSPASTSAWRTHLRSVSEPRPSLRALSATEAPCSRCRRTASSRNSGVYFDGRPILTPLLTALAANHQGVKQTG
jgi:hypothetical protein